MEQVRKWVMLPFMGKLWCCGPLSSGGITIGLTNCVAICFAVLFYLSTVTLEQFVAVIIVMFCSVLLFLANVLLVYGSVQNKSHLLMPWLIITIPATIALLIYTSIKFSDLAPYQSMYIAAFLLSSYFCIVVITQVHELKAQQSAKAPLGEDCEDGEGTRRDNAIISTVEDTMLVELGSNPVVTTTSNGLPQPEEVIKLSPTNPFIEDIFKVKKSVKQSVSAGAMPEIKSDFTPFKKDASRTDNADDNNEESLAKLRIFLPKNAAAEESDFDFSFNDSAFDSSLCATNHPGQTD